MARVFGAVAAFLANRYGGLCHTPESVVTVGVAAVRIVQANSERVGLVLCNNGAADIRIANTPEVTVTTGLRIPAGGGAVSMWVDEDGPRSAMEWWGIGAGAGNVVYVNEVVRETALGGSEGGGS